MLLVLVGQSETSGQEQVCTCNK